jgi:hypothetical protein
VRATGPRGRLRYLRVSRTRISGRLRTLCARSARTRSSSGPDPTGIDRAAVEGARERFALPITHGQSPAGAAPRA